MKTSNQTPYLSEAGYHQLALASNGDSDYVPVPGSSEVYIHMDLIPEVPSGIELNNFTDVFVQSATILEAVLTKRQERAELKRQIAVEAAEGWEFAAHAREAAAAAGRTALYQVQPLTYNSPTHEAGF